MEISWNRGTPKSSIVIGFSPYNPSIWGYWYIYGNHHMNEPPYEWIIDVLLLFMLAQARMHSFLLFQYLLTSACTTYVHINMHTLCALTSCVCYSGLGWGGGRFGMFTFTCTVSSHWCYAVKLSVPSVPTGLMLPYSWVGVWWGGMFTFTCTGTRLWCYAVASSMFTVSDLMLRSHWCCGTVA